MRTKIRKNFENQFSRRMIVVFREKRIEIKISSYTLLEITL